MTVFTARHKSENSAQGRPVCPKEWFQINKLPFRAVFPRFYQIHEIRPAREPFGNNIYKTARGSLINFASKGPLIPFKRAKLAENSENSVNYQKTA